VQTGRGGGAEHGHVIPKSADSMYDSQILIVGGGAAGLSTAGALKRRGLAAIVIDRNARVGDVWAQRYDRLRLHTIYSDIAHYPLPQHYPKYPTKDQYAEYLREYVRRFELDVVAGCAVRKVTRADDGALPGWLIVSDCGDWRARVLVLATGQYGTPVVPNWLGRAEFAGELIHSAAYRNAQPYAGKRVLVIGIGNSGAEIAADLAEQGAAFVAISIRTQAPIVARDAFGMPVQRSSLLLTRLPPRMADVVARTVTRLAVGDLTRHGLWPPAWWPYSAQHVPVIDAGFLRQLKRGCIAARPNIVRFTSSGVVFDNGCTEDFDAVIAATGYRCGLPELLDLPGALDQNGEPAFPSGQPTIYPGLYFMGYTHSLRGHLYEANHDSRRLAKLIEASLRDG
jgi:cation diffusion facilitator CzcD-associated flavoprotein CzcO